MTMLQLPYCARLSVLMIIVALIFSTTRQVRNALDSIILRKVLFPFRKFLVCRIKQNNTEKVTKFTLIKFLLRDIFSSIKFILFFKLISKPYYNQTNLYRNYLYKVFVQKCISYTGTVFRTFPKTHLSVVNLVIICRQLEHIFIKIDKELCFNLNNEI